MIDLNETILIQNLLPLFAAQFFFVFLIYFTLMRKRMRREYPFYALFLGSMIFFLVVRVFNLLPELVSGYYVLYSRMFLLFAVGMPSLTIGAAIQSGVNLSKQGISLFYVAAFLLSLSHIVVADILWYQNYSESIGIGNWEIFAGVGLSNIHARSLIIFMLLVLLIIPGLYLLFRPSEEHKPVELVSGILLFGVFMCIGVSLGEYWIYYVGSLISALVWGSAVCRDLRHMRSKTSLLKEELQLLVQTGRASVTPDLERVLADLERVSRASLDVYKMRVREVLNMLADTTIEAGGDAALLIERNRVSASEIDTAESTEAVREMIQAEAIELSAMIASIPKKQGNATIDQAKAYIAANFQSDIGVDDVAAHLNISRSHLMSSFKKSVGLTFTQYLTQLRIETAKRLLHSQSVTETAFEVGFSNSNYFSTVFKKQTGMTPKAYQQEANTLD